MCKAVLISDFTRKSKHFCLWKLATQRPRVRHATLAFFDEKESPQSEIDYTLMSEKPKWQCEQGQQSVTVCVRKPPLEHWLVTFFFKDGLFRGPKVSFDYNIMSHITSTSIIKFWCCSSKSGSKESKALFSFLWYSSQNILQSPS